MVTRFRLTIALASVLLLAIVGFLYSVFTTVKNFPDLPPGAYVGTISGLAPQPSTFYVERFRGTDTFLFVSFVDSFKPQAVVVNRSGETNTLQPLAVLNGNAESTSL